MSSRRALSPALAVGLSIAAATASLALMTHSFDATDARLIATSLGFSVFSALGAAGAPARRQPKLAMLGALTTGAAWLGFALLELAIWVAQTDTTWRAWGTVALLSLATSHASLVLSARRASDSSMITHLTVTSVLAASVDALLAAAAIVGLVEHATSVEIRFAAVLVIALLLSTALPPILRRATPSTGVGRPRAEVPTPRGAPAPAELHEIAHRLEQLAPRTGGLAHEITWEAARLRAVADRPSRP